MFIRLCDEVANYKLKMKQKKGKKHNDKNNIKRV